MPLLSQIRSAENTLIAALEIERDIDTYSPEELERTIRKLQEARDSLNAMADRHALEGHQEQTLVSLPRKPVHLNAPCLPESGRAPHRNLKRLRCCAGV
jgi:hypothetical protein